MRITYLDNSGFFLAMRDASLVFDCWRFPAPGEAAGFSNGYLDRAVLTERPRAYFFVSHGHADHFHPEIFRFADAAAETMFLLDKDIPVPEGVPHHFLSPGEEFSDGYARVRAFGSTDLGVSFLAEAEGRRIFHAGARRGRPSWQSLSVWLRRWRAGWMRRFSRLTRAWVARSRRAQRNSRAGLRRGCSSPCTLGRTLRPCRRPAAPGLRGSGSGRPPGGATQFYWNRGRRE